MKKHFLSSISLILMLFLFSCRKDVSNVTYSISGRLLESSSNSITISNYRFQVNQKSSYGFFGGVTGIEMEFQTDANGNFNLKYSPQKSTGLSTGSANPYPLSLTGIDTVKYKGLYPNWYPIPANKDTVLNDIFLYKKIDKFVRKVQFNSALANGDSLEVITSNAYRFNYKTLYGPIAAGTLLVLDTINQLKAERYNISTNSYLVSSTLKKPSYQKGFGLNLPLGDELYREQLLIYP